MVITEIFNPIVGLSNPIEIPTKEAKAKLETYLVIVETAINASHSFIHFDLFLQLNNLLPDLFFSI